jgi:hypothetical protein
MRYLARHLTIARLPLPRYRLPDDLAVVGRSGYDGDAPGERIEFGDALLTAHADHLIAPVKRVLHHVLSELSGGSHDTDLHHVYPLPSGTARQRLLALL